MVVDMAVAREVWEGGVIVRFTLAMHEVSGPGTPTPFFLTLPRNSYLPLFNEKIRSHFSSFVKQKDGTEMWFDFNSIPLKWHYPVGILFDILCPENTRKTMEITVHFQDFPEENLLRSHDCDAVEANFMSMLKEADQLKHRGQIINSMNKSQHKRLWNGLKSDNFDLFWSINSKLMEGYENSGAFKFIPLRIYDGEDVHQRLFAPISEDQNEVTLCDCLSEVFEGRDLGSVLIHGISVPLDSTLQWLSEHLSYADNFLHIAIADKAP